jgi:hypothetical protein
MGIKCVKQTDTVPDDVIRALTMAEMGQINAAILDVQADYKNRLEKYYKKHSDGIYAIGYWANR